MTSRNAPRAIFISTHGYVAARPNLGCADTGGQVVYVIESAKSLARLGWQVDILTRQFEGQAASEQVADGVRLLRVPCGGEDFIPKEHLWQHLNEWVGNVCRLLNKQKLRYDCINSHYWDGGYAGQILADRMGRPHAHTPHSLGAWKRAQMGASSDSTNFNFAKRTCEERRVYRVCDRVIATTEQQRHILVGEDYSVPMTRIDLIPPGYDDRRFYPVSSATRNDIRRRLGWSEPTVLALGRLATNKGYDLLVRAMRTITARIPEARLVLAIRGKTTTSEEAEEMKRLKCLVHELQMEQAVALVDRVSDHELADYYRAADVFALSSRYEPFGMTAIEAMACGTPTIVTTEGGLYREVRWGIEALYADPRDHEAFGHGICSMLKHSEVAEGLAHFGAIKARTHYTWADVGRRTHETLSTMCGMGDTSSESDSYAFPHEQLPARFSAWTAPIYS